MFSDRQIDYFENFNLDNIVTPVNVTKLRNLLVESEYDRDKTKFLIEGFTQGFHLGYKGPVNRQDSSPNLPFTPGVGDEIELWNKIMKEVKLNRYAGPFISRPYDTYIQSPIGLVPKAGNQTRLIFHLSYNFGKENNSFNFFTQEDKCKVKYRDLDHAVRNCLRILKYDKNQLIWLSISDLKSAFRIIPGHPSQWRFLLMKAKDPRTGLVYYFADKCLPFGASISCRLYSEFSNALAHILCHFTHTQFRVTNYLDDFLFIENSQEKCQYLVSTFLQLCNYLGVPVSDEKVVWPTTSLKFLGVILNGERKYLQVPNDKKNKALNKL